MSKFTIPTVFKAVDNLSAPLQRMSANMDKFDKSAKGIFGNLSEIQKELFSFAAKAAVITGVSSLFRFGVESIMDYEKALASLEAVTGQSANLFKGQIESIASSSRKSAIDVAKSFEVVGSAMSEYLDNPKALGQITEAGITLSKASRMELEPSLQALTSVMNQFGIAAEGANDTINRLTAGEIVGSVSTQKLSDYLQSFGAVAKMNNVSLAESVALVEVLGKKIPHETLGRASRNMISFMGAIKSRPKSALDELAKNGVDLDIVSSTVLPFGERLKELSKIQGSATAMEAFFGEENIAAGAAIFQNLGMYDEYTKKIQTTNEAQKQAAVNSNTLTNRIAELKNSFVNVIVSGDKMNPMLELMKSLLGVLANNMGLVLGTVGALVGGFLAYKVALLGLNAVMMINEAFLSGKFIVAMIKQIALTNGTTFATAALAVAQSSLNAAWLANPIGVVVAGLMALGLVIYGVSKAYSKLSAEEQVANQLREKTLENTVEQRAEATALFATLRNAAQGSKAYNDTLAKLEQMQPGIIEKYDLHKKSLDNIALAQKDVIANIENMARAEAAAQITREKAMAELRAQNALSDTGFFAGVKDYMALNYGIGSTRLENFSQAKQETEAAAAQEQALNVQAETQGVNHTVDMTIRGETDRVDAVASKGVNIQKPVTTSTIGEYNAGI